MSTSLDAGLYGNMGGDVESVWTDVQKNKFIMSPLSLSLWIKAQPVLTKRLLPRALHKFTFYTKNRSEEKKVLICW